MMRSHYGMTPRCRLGRARSSSTWSWPGKRRARTSSRWSWPAGPGGSRGASLQLLLTTEDQMACLRCIHRHLTPGGRLAFELDSTSVVVMAEWLTHRRGTLQRNPQRDYRHPVTGNQVYSWGYREYHPSQQRYIGRSGTGEGGGA